MLVVLQVVLRTWCRLRRVPRFVVVLIDIDCSRRLKTALVIDTRDKGETFSFSYQDAHLRFVVKTLRCRWSRIHYFRLPSTLCGEYNQTNLILPTFPMAFIWPRPHFLGLLSTLCGEYAQMQMFVCLPASLCLSVFLSIRLSASACWYVFMPSCLSVCLCMSGSLPSCLCLNLPVRLFGCLSSSLPVCMSISMSVCISVCLPVYQYVYLSVWLSVFLPICLSVALSISLSLC